MPALEDGCVLSSQEVEFFKENGFLVKKGLLSQDSTAQALSESWDFLLKNIPVAATYRLCRTDPKSWLDPQWESMPPIPKSGFYEGRQPNVHQGTSVKLHDCGNAPFLLELLPNNRTVRAIAQEFLGNQLRPTKRTRGVYAVFPTRRRPKAISAKMLGPHADRVCQQLNVCAYLDDVPPRNGGFTVYPGAHQFMHHAHSEEANWNPNSSYSDCVKRVVRTITPYELIGNAGDVIFWHGRLIHSAGIHIGKTIRWAVFGDFTQDRPCLSEDEHRELGQYEWFKDTQLFKEDSSPSTNMWKSWNI